MHSLDADKALLQSLASERVAGVAAASQEGASAADDVPQDADDAGPLVQLSDIVEKHYTHTISTNIPVLCGGDASSRKSSLSARTQEFVTKSFVAPPEMQSGELYLVEATLKGIRNTLVSYSRCSATTDEITNTLPTPRNDMTTGVNYPSRAKLNTYTQCEPDGVITGHGSTQVSEYAFQLKGFGQIEAIEWVMRPTANGWQKRLAFTVSPTKNPLDEDACDATSMGLLQGSHDHMMLGPMGQKMHLHLDEFALSMHRTVRRAVVEWIEASSARVCSLIATSLLS